MGVGLRRIEEQIGRPLAADEFEPMNRVQAEIAAHFTAVDYALAFSAATHFRRSVQAWWADGWDLLLTPTVAELPLPLGTIRNDPDNPLAAMERSFQFIPFTPPFNMSGQPAINVPVVWTDAGLPVGVQLVAGYGREDVLLRVASQLESARPWAQRIPDVGRCGDDRQGSAILEGRRSAAEDSTQMWPSLLTMSFAGAVCGLPICRSRPEVGAVRVFHFDGGPADRRRHLVDLWIAKRRNLSIIRVKSFASPRA